MENLKNTLTGLGIGLLAGVLTSGLLMIFLSIIDRIYFM